MAWRNLTYYAIVVPAYLPLLAAAVPAWAGYRKRYLSGWRTWLPAMLIVAAVASWQLTDLWTDAEWRNALLGGTLFGNLGLRPGV